MRSLLPLSLACSIALSAVAQVDSRPKEPWKWTLEERIALRTNPAAAAARLKQQHKGLRGGSANGTLRGRPIVDQFTGQSYPELFLPVELFGRLISMGFLGDVRAKESIQRGLLPELRRHGLPDDFWQRLRVAATVYIADEDAFRTLLADLKGQSGTARERIQQAIDLKQADICRSRAAALAAARAEFGAERFDRFLYELIAPGMFHIADSLQKPSGLRRIEEGCR